MTTHNVFHFVTRGGRRRRPRAVAAVWPAPAVCPRAAGCTDCGHKGRGGGGRRLRLLALWARPASPGHGCKPTQRPPSNHSTSSISTSASQQQEQMAAFPAAAIQAGGSRRRWRRWPRAEQWPSLPRPLSSRRGLIPLAPPAVAALASAASL